MAISDLDRRFLHLCDDARQKSHDPDRKVGAVIVDNLGQILAIGSNTPPPSLGLSVAESHEAIREDPNWKYFMLEHAERNAIFGALAEGKSLVGATMYGTLFPCADCARAIVSSGIARLVVIGPSLDPVRDEKWLAHYHHAEQLFELAGLPVSIVNPDEVYTRPPR